jgi:hypothetical protein
MLLAQKSGIAERVEFLLSLTHQGVQPGLHIRQFVSDVVHENLGRNIQLAK